MGFEYKHKHNLFYEVQAFSQQVVEEVQTCG